MVGEKRRKGFSDTVIILIVKELVVSCLSIIDRSSGRTGKFIGAHKRVEQNEDVLHWKVILGNKVRKWGEISECFGCRQVYILS